MKKSKNLILIMGLLISIAAVFFVTEKLRKPTFVSYSKDECAQRIFESSKIYDEGLRAEKMDKYDFALNNYAEAIAVAIRPTQMDCGEYDSTGMARAGIRRVFEKQGKYEEALERHKRFLYQNPSKDAVDEKYNELQALVDYQKAGEKKTIYHYIVALQEKHQKSLPPQALNTYTAIVATTIIRLYDLIVDQDKGIAFVDQILAYPDLSEKSRQEYQKIKVAFEEDKAKGASGSPTKVLIQSDYFPW